MDIGTWFNLAVVSVSRAGLYTLMATGLSLLFGVMNIPNFAHGALYMLGAYYAVLTYKFLGLNFFLTIVLAAISGFLIGVVLEKVFFYPLRQRAAKQRVWIMNSFLLTVGLSIVLQNAIQAIFGTKYRGIEKYWEGGLKIAGSSISLDRIIGILIAGVAIGIFWFFLKKTTLGLAIQAVAQDETGAQTIGINLNNIHTLTFGLSSMLAGVAGATLLPLKAAYPAMGELPLFSSWFVVILVGLGNIAAVPMGAVIIGLIETISYYYMGAGWQRVITLLLIILLLLFKPRGLFGSDVKGIWER